MDKEDAHTPFNIEYELSVIYEFDDISKDEYNKFIKGDILKNENFKGYVGIKYNNLTVGFGKASNNQIKNHLPKGLRIN